MRESEMRQRAESLIKRGMQGMLTPGLALSLALAGCGGSDYMAQFPRHDASSKHDGAGPASDTPVYSAPFPDVRGLDEAWDGSEPDVVLAPAFDLAPGLDLATSVIDTSNEASGLDADKNTRG